MSRNHIANFIGDDINCNQLGFVNGKSILSYTLESFSILNKYLMIEDNRDIVYLDFSKAFDRVSRYHLFGSIRKIQGTSKNTRCFMILFNK